jgi:hypothetical protein
VADSAKSTVNDKVEAVTDKASSKSSSKTSTDTGRRPRHRRQHRREPWPARPPSGSAPQTSPAPERVAPPHVSDPTRGNTAWAPSRTTSR